MMVHDDIVDAARSSWMMKAVSSTTTTLRLVVDRVKLAINRARNKRCVKVLHADVLYLKGLPDYGVKGTQTHSTAFLRRLVDTAVVQDVTKKLVGL